MAIGPHVADHWLDRASTSQFASDGGCEATPLSTDEDASRSGIVATESAIGKGPLDGDADDAHQHGNVLDILVQIGASHMEIVKLPREGYDGHRLARDLVAEAVTRADGLIDHLEHAFDIIATNMTTLNKSIDESPPDRSVDDPVDRLLLEGLLKRLRTISKRRKQLAPWLL